jgi:hypothetical protein
MACEEEAGSDLGIHAKLREGAISSPERYLFTWYPLMVEASLALCR